MDEMIKKKDSNLDSHIRDVVAYHKERNAATLSVVKESNRKWILSLSDTLNAAVPYNVPLTIRMKRPVWLGN
jgi:hypothetical protein